MHNYRPRGGASIPSLLCAPILVSSHSRHSSQGDKQDTQHLSNQSTRTRRQALPPNLTIDEISGLYWPKQHQCTHRPVDVYTVRRFDGHYVTSPGGCCRAFLSLLLQVRQGSSKTDLADPNRRPGLAVAESVTTNAMEMGSEMRRIFEKGPGAAIVACRKMELHSRTRYESRYVGVREALWGLQ